MNKKQLDKDLKPNTRKTRLEKTDFTIIAGIYKANKVTLNEVAINNCVLRVPLSRSDIEDTTSGSPSDESELKTITRSKTATSQKFTRNRKTSLNMNRSEVSSEKSQMTDVKEPKKIFKYRPLGSKSSTTLNQFINKTTSANDSPSKAQDHQQRNINGNCLPFSIVSASNNSESKTVNNSRLIVKTKRTKSQSMGRGGRPSYRLEFAPYRPVEDRILNYKFSKLAVDVRSLRLPAANWKIKIYMKNKAISAIAFTNKQDVERILKFNSASDVYELTIDNKKARLLGSPLTVDNGQDVEVLLDIIHNISAQNPMIMYL